MFSDEQIEKIIRKKIESEEKLGTHAGGSGHLNDISYNIDDIQEPVKCDEGWEVTYQYTIVVISEFTVWPDNPPHEHRNAKKIILDEKGNIVKESPVSPYMDGSDRCDFTGDFEDLDIDDL